MKTESKSDYRLVEKIFFYPHGVLTLLLYATGHLLLGLLLSLLFKNWYFMIITVFGYGVDYYKHKFYTKRGYSAPKIAYRKHNTHNP